ncbi:chemosensory receptor c [Plakobranchus ocellatus]|uniref:Chemosensory receptor c n=1 Tax=Plakobranchus ocellatus TaxID=259542 RepID=A0AAV4CI00_9GAST|nr:chemosensory receptor c [Plakobranchus ocellatus]
MNNSNISSSFDPSAWPFSAANAWTTAIVFKTWPVILLFGLLANMINIVVFIRAGIKDNVTISLFSLSMSDLMFLFLNLPTVSTLVVVQIHPDWPWRNNIVVVEKTLYWPAFTFYDFSSYVSVWLGVTRCACVAMPLQFKSVFTKARTVKAVLFLFVIAVSLRLPIIVVQSYLARLDPIQLTVNRFNDILNRSILPWLTFIIMIACVCIMRVKLYQASAVRSSHTSAAATDSKQEADGLDTHAKSSKEFRVVQLVFLICCIFILSQLLFLVYSTVRIFVPDFDLYKRLHNLLLVCAHIGRTFSFLNASVNIFVYYNYNSKYRSIFLSMLKPK